MRTNQRDVLLKGWITYPFKRSKLLAFRTHRFIFKSLLPGLQDSLKNIQHCLSCIRANSHRQFSVQLPSQRVYEHSIS